MTAPWLLDHAPYTPFMEPRTARAPGLSPLDMDDWTVRHADFAAQMARRREIMAAHHDQVVAALGPAEPAELELLAMLNTHLGDGPRALTLKERFCPLTAMAHLVAEDFCLLLPDDVSGEYILVAAILCFPSRWNLQEKMGRPLTIIHDPVPDYDETLARRVIRVFETLRPDRPLVRANWTVHATPELYLPKRAGRKPDTVSGAARFYLRTERQTLVRLPETGAVAFGIKTSLTPVGCLQPAEARALAAATRALEPATLRYRWGGSVREALIAELEAIAR